MHLSDYRKSHCLATPHSRSSNSRHHHCKRSNPISLNRPTKLQFARTRFCAISATPGVAGRAPSRKIQLLCRRDRARIVSGELRMGSAEGLARRPIAPAFKPIAPAFNMGELMAAEAFDG
jgi:hypothetical protein